LGSNPCGNNLLAMKLFGYRDVQMFFIPMFGAAVSGSETSPNGTKRAVVALLGPAPGIALGIACAVLFHSTGNPVFMQAARTFLILNTFNLLPFAPLDGGHYMEAVLFSRTPMLRALFDIGAGLGLAGLAIALRSGLLGLLAFVVFVSVRSRYFSSRLAGQIKDELAAHDANEQSSEASNFVRERIPSEYVERLTPMLENRLPEAARTPARIAKEMRGVWNMVWFKPPSIAVSVGLVFLYLASFGIGLLATVGAEVSFLPPSSQPDAALHVDAAPQ